MAVITLTTDFGHKDYFVSAVKGAIYSLIPDTKIVDISHLISPFNIKEAAYILKNAYKSFPKGSIHIVGVDAEKTPENKHIALLLNDQYFICANNGILSLISQEISPTKIVEINIHDRIDTYFPVLNVFINVACHLARGGTLDVIGKNITEIHETIELQPKVISDNKLIGNIIYVDHYGNVVTNITKDLFLKIGKNRKFKLSVGNYKFDTIHEKYSDIVNFDKPKHKRNHAGNRLALFNSTDFLEIAIYKSNLETVGGASSLLGLDHRSVLSIEFFDL